MSLEKFLNQALEGADEPDLAYMSWNVYLSMCKEVGVEPKEGLIPGRGVILAKGGIVESMQ